MKRLWLGAFVLSSCGSTDGSANASRPAPSQGSVALNAAVAATTEFEDLTLRGTLHEESGAATKVGLTLARHGDTWQGNLREGELAPFSLLEVELSRLEGTDTQSAYRLTYIVDSCEHEKPSQRPPMVPWRADPPCFHDEPGAKPRVLRKAEVRVTVNKQFHITLERGNFFTASAVGSPNIGALDSALLLRGLVR